MKMYKYIYKIGVAVACLLLCGCSSSREVVERTDTVRVVEREVVEAARRDSVWVRDTASVVIERFDTVARLVERVRVERGRTVVRTVRDTVVVRDTVSVAAGSGSVERRDVSVNSPVAWWQEWWGLVAGMVAVAGGVVLVWRWLRR